VGTTEGEAPTETIAKPGDDPKTEVIRTVGDEHTKPGPQHGKD
jgi:hypothetical protein